MTLSTRAAALVNNLPSSNFRRAKSRPVSPEFKLAARDLLLARRLQLRLSFKAFAALLLILAPRADAQSLWNGATGNWSVDANWLPVGAPVSSSSTDLIFGGSSGYTATNDIGNFSLYELQFTNSAGTVILNGSPTTNALDFVNSSVPALPAITLSGAGSATISAPVIWGGETSVTNSGSGALLFNGSQTFVNGTKDTFTNSGSGSITLADAITYGNSGSGGLVLNLINNSATGSFNVGNLGGLASVTVNVGGTGVVSFSGSTGGDLFSNSAILNVLSGATFDFKGNGETFGAFSGAGTIRTTVGLSPTAAGYYVFSGNITGAAGNITLAGSAETLDLSGSTSDYTGATTVTAGRLVISANAPNGSPGALGNATSAVLIGDTSGSASASMTIDTAGVTIGRNITVQSGNTGVATLGGLNTTGSVNYSGNVTLGTNALAAHGLTLTAAPGGTALFSGNLLRATSATGTTDALTVTGGGTVALQGANTFTGATTVNAGTLLLDYTLNNSAKLSAAAPLTLNGGSLSLTGNGSAPSSETVASLTLGNAAAPFGDGGQITVTSGANENITLVLGAITRNTGATVNFNLVNTGSGAAGITTSTPNIITPNGGAGILGSYATINGMDWAVNDGSGNIVPLAAGIYTTSFASGTATSLPSSAAIPSGGATTNTLRFTGAAALTFASGTNTLNLETGGILVAAGTGTTSIGTTSIRGAISPTTGELIVQQESTTGTLTINSVISGTTLTKAGPGALTLTGTNTYTGSTIIDGGTLSVTASANLGAATTGITINGGTLALPSGTLGSVVSTGHIVTVGPAGATFNFTANQAFSGNGFTGTGPVTKTGTGTWSVGSNGSNFNGSIAINAGMLSLTSNQLGSVSGITIANGGTYQIDDDGVGTFSIASGQRFVINGSGAGATPIGAISLVDQTQLVPGPLDPTSTISNEVSLQTTSQIETDNGSAVGSLSTLILSGPVTGAGGLIKAGNGTLTLSGANNTYGGSTTVTNGTLSVNLGNDRLPTSTTVTLGAAANSGIFQLNGFSQTIAGLATAGSGASNSVVGGSATTTSLLDLNVASGSQTYNGSLGGTGARNTHANNNLGLIKDGAGTVVLSSANTYNGGTTVNAGTLVLGNAGALGNTGATLATVNGGVTVNAGATLDISSQSNVQAIIALNGMGVGGNGALVNNGATVATIGNGIASLSVPSVTTTGWTAGATISIGAPNSGTAATAAAQLGLSAASLTVTNGGSGFSTSSAATIPVVTVSGGSGAVVTASLGVTTASFAITSGTTVYSVAPTVVLQDGATAIANLTNGLVTSITVTNPGAGFTTTPTISFTGGTVATAGTTPASTGNTINFTVSALNVVNAGTGFNSVPTVTITGGSGATAVGNDGNFVLEGFLITGNGSGYTSAPAVSVTGGTAVATANVAAINLASDSSIGGSGDLVVNPGITGIFGLTKVGAGTATLAGANTYTGITNVSAGKLLVSGSLSGTTQINVTGGALQLGASNALNSAAALNLGGGTFATAGFSQGDSATVGLGLLSVSANSVIDFGTGDVSQLMFAGVGAHPTGTLSIENWNGTPNQIGNALDDRLMFAGDSTALQNFETLYAQSDISFNGVQGYDGIQYDPTHFEIVAVAAMVPEPSSAVLLGAGLLGLAGYRGRRRPASMRSRD